MFSQVLRGRVCYVFVVFFKEELVMFCWICRPPFCITWEIQSPGSVESMPAGLDDHLDTTMLKFNAVFLND
jgi:hypothetical protein